MVASYRKVIVVEPRYSDEFEAAMRQFYEVIESTGGGGKDGDGSVNGALFIAVCRGKVRSGHYPYFFRYILLKSLTCLNGGHGNDPFIG